ncbi:hypothetical protein [Hymenobacter sp. 102]|uniref:hypothetical protein n=1 Tax=Hymenobacter sp. 102 TaxID=3403152 RepID=UPI003CEC4798
MPLFGQLKNLLEQGYRFGTWVAGQPKPTVLARPMRECRAFASPAHVAADSRCARQAGASRSTPASTSIIRYTFIAPPSIRPAARRLQQFAAG